MAAIATSSTEHSNSVDRISAPSQGYHAAFWTVFAATAITVVVTFFGLRKGGFTGKKDE
jgi:hypothetical protein